MNIAEFLDSIDEIDPRYLKSVDDRTFEYILKGTYLSSTNKGLSKLFSSLGLYDKVFISKLYNLDSNYTITTINNHLITSTHNSNKLLLIDNNLRIMSTSTYNNLYNLLSYYKDYDNKLITYNDILYNIIYNYYNNNNYNKIITYNYNNNNLLISYYNTADNKFYGNNDYQIKLEDYDYNDNSIIDLYSSTSNIIIDNNQVSKFIIRINKLGFNNKLTDQILRSSLEDSDSEISRDRLLSVVNDYYSAHKDDPKSILNAVELSENLFKI